MKVMFYTRRHSYTITVTKTYCGAVTWNRQPRDGEDWLRGNDLRDGPIWKFPLVLWDILRYEIGFGRWRRRRLIG